MTTRSFHLPLFHNPLGRVFDAQNPAGFFHQPVRRLRALRIEDVLRLIFFLERFAGDLVGHYQLAQQRFAAHNLAN